MQADDNDRKFQQVPFLCDIISISSGEGFNLCLDKNGAVWGFGANKYDQLGLGPEYSEISKIDTPIINPYLKDITFIECGYDFSLCIEKNGRAYTFGRNSCGECGAGDNATVIVPYCLQSIDELQDVVFVSGSCGHVHTILIDKYNNLYGFGDNEYHQIGNIYHTDEQKVPYKITKKDVGIEENLMICRVICDDTTSIIICEE